MPDTIVKDVAETRPGEQLAPAVESNVGISFLPPFTLVKDILESSPSPRRPNRNRPLHDETELEMELSCWEAAGAEALEAFEDSLEE